MKIKLIIILLTSFFVSAFVSVSRATAYTPTVTEGIEKAAPDFFGGCNGEGVIINYDLTNFATPVVDLRLAVIHWDAEEWFYTCGYKAKLSDAIEEIIAPPDNLKYSDVPFKVGWRA